MEKKIILTRLAGNEKAVYGVLSIVEDGVITFVCKTIENKEKTFPAGIYPIKLEHSPSFNTKLWELYGIPGRSEIKVHVANYYDQLDGCIGVGATLEKLNADNVHDITSSAPTLAAFHNKMAGVSETRITVVNLF